jgi:formylglycine-generating enzyme required for sulfatase activity
VLLLVSADFIASDYCWGEEMAKALDRHKRDEAQVIPVILRYCAWQSTPLGELQAVPKNAKPVKSWLDRDEALYDVVAAIERAVERVRESAAPPSRQPVSPARIESKPAPPKTESTKPTAKQPPAPPSEPNDMPNLSVFRDIDAPWYPELVLLPKGTFLMGSPDTDEQALDNEKPQHEVTIAHRVAVGRTPVTFVDYDHFCDATRLKKPDDEGWGRGRRSVIHMSWKGAVAYTEWLSRETGETYRLLSEAEWEYACRAGTKTRYSVDDTITDKDANFEGRVGKTTEVGSYPANAWGLHDMHGNVWEWVADCYQEDAYKTHRAYPAMAGSWQDSCSRVLRGDSWGDYPWLLRSAIRHRINSGCRNSSVGFRVARTL